MPRRIVLCLDGTRNNAYQQRFRNDGTGVVKPSNVLKLFRSICPRTATGSEQMAYYDIGVGALSDYPGLANRLLYLADKIFGGAWGAGFEGNIDDALQFLAANYLVDDEVFIFGFSRGAATARGLTRFLAWSGGIPKKSDVFFLPHLFRGFVMSHGERTCEAVITDINIELGRTGRPRLEPFQPVEVKFLGVWDTVMALGARFRAAGKNTSTVSRSFYVDRQPARCVRHARQALAIDELRFDFRPEIWTTCEPGQTLEQRWFAGVHSNVGGGYVDDGLANCAFQWILKEAMRQGLDVDTKFAAHFGAFAQDRLYRSESLGYRILDALRWRFGRGRRTLVDQPIAANLSVDPSVIRRIRSDPKERTKTNELRFPELERRYRPENVITLLASQADLDRYLATLGVPADARDLPADVMARISEERARGRTVH